MNKSRYEIIIDWSEADQAFIAKVPELAGCAADGPTYQEALAAVEVVIGEWLETARELGRPIPTPQDRLLMPKGVSMYCKLPLILEPQPEGGFTVTSPLLPALITEGDTVEDALDNVRDALAAVIEAYQETGRSLPSSLLIADPEGPVWAETVVAVP